MTSPVLRVTKHSIPTQTIREYPRATKDAKPHALKLAINQYTPVASSQDSTPSITIVAAGGNGFHKELYEPLFEEIYKQCQQKGYDIANFWLADAAHQGESALQNEGLLGNDPSALDFSRDIFSMIYHFQIPAPIIALGHSMGASCLQNIASFHPSMFTRMILYEPILGHQDELGIHDHTPEGTFFAHFALQRPKSWPSREAAEKWSRKMPPYKAWDPRVFDRWMQYGFRETSPGGPVVLVTDPYQDAATYVRPRFDPSSTDPAKDKAFLMDKNQFPDYDSNVIGTGRFYCPGSTQMLAKLPAIRPPVTYIFGGKSPTSPPSKRDYLVTQTGSGHGGSGGQKVGATTSILLEKDGHLSVFEKVELCAELAVAEIGKFVEADRERNPEYDTMQISDRWKSEAAQSVQEAVLKKAKAKL